MATETIRQLLARVTPETAKALVHATRTVLDAIGAEQSRIAASAAPPGGVDYAAAGHDRTSPAGGWITPDELRERGQAMSEAIAAEKWIDGVVAAIQALALLGVI
ncbi:MAG: hypothetical protein U1A27_00180 [Phycisphaerae bacterium]